MNKLHILLVVMIALTSNYGIDGFFFCFDLYPENTVDVSKIEGLWYGREVLQHASSNSTDSLLLLNSNDGEKQVDSCIVIHIRETTDKQYTPRTSIDHFEDLHQYNHVSLLWQEGGQFVENALRYDTNKRGFWESSPPMPIDKDAERNTSSTQFNGTVQVMKAVDNQLVLTFCQTLPTEQFFSIILTKTTAPLTAEEIQSVKSLILRRRLVTKSSRGVCHNLRSYTKAEQQQRSYLFLNIKKW